MNDADRWILDHFAGVRNRTIELVRQMPEDLLEQTPDGEDMSLRWHFVHIADGSDWWMTQVMKDGGAWGWPPPYSDSRASLLQGLAASRDRLVRFFSANDGERMSASFTLGESEWIGRDRVGYLTDHEIHHRGRIVLALLQWGCHELLGEEWLWPPTAESR